MDFNLIHLDGLMNFLKFCMTGPRVLLLNSLSRINIRVIGFNQFLRSLEISFFIGERLREKDGQRSAKLLLYINLVSVINRGFIELKRFE